MPIQDIDTDKYYWHRYLDEYERLVFSNLSDAKCILEIGVGVKQNTPSIELLSHRFPNAQIFGADVLEQRPTWFVAGNVSYVKLDQSNKISVDIFFTNPYRGFELIIDDGSHAPQHQANCLVPGMKALNSAGYYIVEDLHTSEHITGDTPVRVLLALEHLRRVSTDNDKAINTFSSIAKSFFSSDELIYLFNVIEDVYFFRRATLPLRCSGHSYEYFNYSELKCQCGVSLLDPRDSLTCIIKKK